MSKDGLTAVALVEVYGRFWFSSRQIADVAPTYVVGVAPVVEVDS